MNKPNVLYIFPDQLGATWMGTYGHPDVLTPCIDEFAKSAVTFNRSYTVSPLCTPARGALWTSRYPRQTGIKGNQDPLPKDEKTIAHCFKDAGYKTMYLGKWHLSGGGREGVPVDMRGGFDQWLGWEAFHVDHWDGKIWGDETDEPIQIPGHETDGQTEFALDWLREQTTDKPFFFAISYQAPHAPCMPPAEYLELYKNKDLHVRPNVDTEAYMSPSYGGERREEWNSDWRGFVERYYGEISQLDAAIGRLLDELEKNGLADNTIVVFHSDHGENAGAHGRFEKHVMREESIHVPLIIRDPRGAKGIRRDELVSTVDITPTLLELCDLPALESAEGVSHATAVKGKEKIARESMISELHGLCLIRGKLKLETDLEAKEPIALYDIDKDPYEHNNILNNPVYQEQQNAMFAELKSIVADLDSRKMQHGMFLS